ncbi:MAG TPA: LLM class flavin-dependent oxidoreductase [Nevskiaceae bacterium]|nr:LLM class flavin-dependent oxidoreductase [Nevskiaceae bacterium]
MRLSIAFTGFTGLESTLPAVLAAEKAGFDGVWSAEHIGFHDAVVPSAMYLRETKRLEVGLVGLSTAGRHPGITAMELLSLSEIGKGRVRVAVGLGDASLVAKLGRKDFSKPLAQTTAFVTCLRDTMRGADMKVSHPEFTFDGFRVSPLGPPPPIDVMAIKPKMTALAARIGDGLSISVGASRQYIRDTVAAVEQELAAAGRDRKSFRITAMALAVVSPNLEVACGPVKAMFSMFPQETAEYLARGVVEPGSLVAAAKNGPMAVMKEWTQQAVEGVIVAATPDRIAPALQSYADTGVDELSLILFGDPSEQPALVEQIARARPG